MLFLSTLLATVAHIEQIEHIQVMWEMRVNSTSLYQVENFNRSRLVEAMDRLGCRLKILLTDACSYGVPVREINLNPQPPEDFYKNLFFQHKGFLNATAASPGQYAISTPQLGGLFTVAFTSVMTAPPLSIGEDGFATWEEVFRETYQKTQAFFEHVYQGPLFPRAQLESIEQTNQHPVYFGAFPRPIR